MLHVVLISCQPELNRACKSLSEHHGYRTKLFNHHCRELKFAANNIVYLSPDPLFVTKDLLVGFLSLLTDVTQVNHFVAGADSFSLLYPFYLFSFSQT